MTLASVSMIVPLQNGHTVGRSTVTSLANGEPYITCLRSIDNTLHDGSPRGDRLFQSEQLVTRESDRPVNCQQPGHDGHRR